MVRTVRRRILSKKRDHLQENSEFSVITAFFFQIEFNSFYGIWKMELNEENTSADSRSSSVFDEVITKNSEENVSLSPKSEKYRIKKFYLQKKCDDIQKVSARLLNRIYRIRKEISYLRAQKRMLCQQLTTIMDNYSELSLDIPESEPCLTGMELFSDEASLSILIPKKRKFAEAKLSAASDFSTMEENARKSIISIIDSVITESHEERMRAEASNDVHMGNSNNPSTENFNVESSTNAKNDNCVTDVDGQSMVDRMLRASSIDHLLPIEPENCRSDNKLTVSSNYSNNNTFSNK